LPGPQPDIGADKPPSLHISALAVSHCTAILVAATQYEPEGHAVLIPELHMEPAGQLVHIVSLASTINHPAMQSAVLYCTPEHAVQVWHLCGLSIKNVLEGHAVHTPGWQTQVFVLHPQPIGT